MINFFVAFLAVFFSGQQASILFGFAGSKLRGSSAAMHEVGTDISPGMTKACSAVNYLFWLEELEPTIKENDINRKNIPTNFQSLHVNEVHFSYPMRPDTRILKGVNVKVRVYSSHLPD